MGSLLRNRRGTLKQSAACAAIAWLTLAGCPALAQDVPAERAQNEQDIVVTGSRLDRAGFDAPTPTIVLGPNEIALGGRASIGAVLQDQPQFRSTAAPTTNPANTTAGGNAADLRSLGTVRTLTLLNGRRFIGDTDLNNVPLNVVRRVEVVTGGASAAWGSGAVAGVVNLILDDTITGLRAGVQGGISSRGDGLRYGIDGVFGARFADGRGHIMISGEYLTDEGVFGRNSGDRPNMDAAFFTDAAGRILLLRDVNFTNAFPGGVITSGVLNGRVFNRDGTLSPFPIGTLSNATSTTGGGGRSQLDYAGISSPFDRATVYARASYEISDAAKIWIDGRFTRVSHGNTPFFAEVVRATATAGGFLIGLDNAFLPTAVRNQVIAAGQTNFRLGRTFDDVGPLGLLSFSFVRDNIEGAIGIDGKIGAWKYSAYFGHGELRDDQTIANQRIVANFNNAIDAVISPTTGQPVCRIALTTPGTACRPLNLFGSGNISADAVAYAFGAARNVRTTKLDTAGLSVRGDLVDLWAGPLSLAFGIEARWESSVTNFNDPLSTAGSFAVVNYTPLNGRFNVKEGFIEAGLPILAEEGSAEIDLNGAARYSDYSNSGGIWTWKAGATARFFDSILLRAVRSRDIRSPSIAELFTTRVTNIQPITDPFRANEVVTVFRFGGGNPALRPEIATTTTIGASISPKFLPGFSFSVDYYEIDIRDVIGSLSGQDVVTQCFRGNAALCTQIVRDAGGQITTVFATNFNLASYRTRGLDFELSYQSPRGILGSALPGSLRVRALATFVDRLIINDGVNTYDRAGDVGDGAAFTTPKWRGTGTITYQDDVIGTDLRVRYVSGGRFNSLLPIVDNNVASRTYVDLAVRVQVSDSFTLSATVNNLFDRDPPLTIYTSANYDTVGRYFHVAARVKF